ncbi:hypothetical protein DPMN_107142 [Dreissena polymorpha]|uniref:Uncharacterized protein n=1 Tax=Dreissena polymorpha TaxID=45954 RepID=A0A9D4K6A7_DREPO|nr:hypothetical protein DPMN_107142 [Dreissena polymorpha]
MGVTCMQWGLFVTCKLSWVPTADQINSIKPDQALRYWSGSVGMSGRGRSGVPDPLDLYPSYFRSSQGPLGRAEIVWGSGIGRDDRVKIGKMVEWTS